MADEISNKTLAFLLVVAIAISLGGTFVSMNRLNTLMNLPGVTGFATANSTGTANVTITASASIRFAVNNLDFGIGAVNSSAGNTVCSLASGSVAAERDCGVARVCASAACAAAFRRVPCCFAALASPTEARFAPARGLRAAGLPSGSAETGTS